MYDEITAQSRQAILELIDAAKLSEGDIFVVGCSSSEILGEHIGKGSSPEVAEAVFEGIYPVLCDRRIYIAAQCCEHLNRAIIIEHNAAVSHGFEEHIVNVVPQPKAGGSFATATYNHLSSPVALDYVQAKAGIDIGGTLIGMHLTPVAVPVRLSINKIGEANIICARTRLRFIGGERAHYDPSLM